MTERVPWWRDAVVYQLSSRSFADGVVVNVGSVPVERPIAVGRVPLASEPLSDDGRSPGDAAAWLA